MEGVHRLTAQGKPVQVAPSMQEQYGIPVNTHTPFPLEIYISINQTKHNLLN